MIPRALVPAIPLALAALVVSAWNCGLTEKEGSHRPRPASIGGLYPDFDPGQRRYVSRCGRGAAPIEVSGRGARVTAMSAARSGPNHFAAPPGEDFAIAVVDGGERRTYRVRCLPADFPRWRFESAGKPAPGLFVVSFRASPRARPWVIVFDHRGAPRWWYSPRTRVLWAQILRDGTVSLARSFGDGYGLDPRMAHEIRSLSGNLIRIVRTRGSVVDGHEFHELANGNVLVPTYAPAGGFDLRRFDRRRRKRAPGRAAVVFAEIQEIDPQGRVVWRWNSRGRIGLGETGRWWRNVLSNPKRSGLGGTFDPVHINSIEPRGPNEVVISTRHTDAVYGIERSSGRILWKLGGTETPQSLKVVGDPAEKLFGGQHDARMGEDGRLTVYDNGKDRPRRPRVVSYRLDLRRGTATYLGQLNDPRITSSHCCGSARRLIRGGWLVSWGDNPLISAFDREGRTTFRLSLPVSSFRAVPVPEGATTVAALDRGLEAMEDAERVGSDSH